MESRKRLVRDVASSETSPRPMKRADLGVGKHTSGNDVEDTVAEGSKRVFQSQVPSFQLPASRETNVAQPKLITPINSFHELRRVSQVFETSTEPLRSKRDDSSTESRESPVFQLSVERNEALVSPLPCTVVLRDGSVRRVSLLVAEPCDAKPLAVPRKENMPETDPAEKSEQSSKRKNHAWGSKALVLMTALFVSACFVLTPKVNIEDPGSIYVPGGGFSGFWFTLGRLNSIEEPLNKKYYCYSAGCLGVVAMLSNVTMESAYGYAAGAQKRWQRGELSRYDVTETFVNGLLYDYEDIGAVSSAVTRPAFEDPRILSTLRIITSERKGSLCVKAAIRTPQNVNELKDMLLQTTWIPFAISRDLWHKQHMDGAFTIREHPRCPKSLGYALDWDIILNALNVNLSYDKVALLWKKGLSMGI